VKPTHAAPLPRPSGNEAVSSLDEWLHLAFRVRAERAAKLLVCRDTRLIVCLEHPETEFPTR